MGFRVSSYKAGSVAIGPISHLIHLPKNMVKVALAFQDYIRGSSLKPFDPENHEGCWKNLTVRTSTNGQVLIILLISAKVLNTKFSNECILFYYTLWAPYFFTVLCRNSSLKSF